MSARYASTAATFTSARYSSTMQTFFINPPIFLKMTVPEQMPYTEHRQLAPKPLWQHLSLAKDVRASLASEHTPAMRTGS